MRRTLLAATICSPRLRDEHAQQAQWVHQDLCPVSLQIDAHGVELPLERPGQLTPVRGQGRRAAGVEAGPRVHRQPVEEDQLLL